MILATLAYAGLPRLFAISSMDVPVIFVHTGILIADATRSPAAVSAISIKKPAVKEMPFESVSYIIIRYYNVNLQAQK